MSEALPLYKMFQFLIGFSVVGIHVTVIMWLSSKDSRRDRAWSLPKKAIVAVPATLVWFFVLVVIGLPTAAIGIVGSIPIAFFRELIRGFQNFKHFDEGEENQYE